MQMIISSAKKSRSDLNIVFNWHVDDVVSGSAIIAKKIKTIGRMLDDKYNPAAMFSIVLFTNVDFDRKGTPVYGYITNMAKIDGTIIPAKSPEGMFEPKIENDLKQVITSARKYFFGDIEVDV